MPLRLPFEIVVEIVLGHVDEGFRAEGAGVVDEHVDGPETVDGGLDEVRACLWVADVANDGPHRVGRRVDHDLLVDSCHGLLLVCLVPA